MADVNRTIAIDMQMDLAKFKAALKQIPGMTKKEAQAMVKGLQTELRQAQRASQKTAQVNKKAMQQVGRSFDAAKAKARSLRVQTRNAAGAFGAMSDVIGEINPELASLAVTMGTVGSATRGLARSLASGNVILIAFTVIVTTAIAAYTLFTSSARKAKEIQKRFTDNVKQTRKALADFNKKMEESSDKMRGNASEVNATVLQYQLLSGAITEAEVSQLKMEQSIENMASRLTAEKEKQLAVNAQQLFMLEAQKTFLDAQYKVLVERGEVTKNHRELTKQATELFAEMERNSKEIARVEAERDSINRDTTKQIESQVEQYRKASEGIAKINKQQEAEREAQEQQQKAREAALERLRDIEQQITQQQQQRLTLAEQNRASEISRMDARAQIVATYGEEREAIEEQQRLLEEQIQMVKQNASSKQEKEAAARFEVEAVRNLVQMEEQQHNLRLDFRKELSEFDDKERVKQEEAAKKQAELEKKLQAEKVQQMRNGLKLSIDNLGSFAEFGLKLLAETGNKNKTLINVLFKAQQASALANIAMSTAEGIAAAPAQYGPFAPLAIAGILASAAAQTAVVMQQKPPLHMGGFVAGNAPDETQRTLLSGEAVLDRNTVARLGGPQGIQSLQEGKMQQSVVVMQPFKHLDRYNKSALMAQNNPLKSLQPRLGSGAY